MNQIMKNFVTMSILLALSACTSCAKSERKTYVSGSVMNVMFYNSENLFDTVDNPDKNDDEFLPSSARRWTTRRYWNKLNNMCKVIAAVDEENAPEMVGLCEVENDSVLYDLTRRTQLKSLGYDYVVTDSPDERGINVALLYKKSYFRLLSYESLPVNIRPAGGSATRDILHVTGRITNGDTLDLYVCHWPSRIGGVEESEPRRQIAAGVALNSILRVFEERRKPYVILMGDLNEGADDPAVRQTLRARRLTEGAELPDRELVTMMDGQTGSYRYEGAWDTYDQFVVSASLLNELGCTGIEDVETCRLEFVLEEDKKYGGEKPFRTYNGYRYQNGYSDHLPINLWLHF